MKEKIFGDLETIILFVSVLAGTILTAWIFNFLFKRSIKRSIKKFHADPTNYQFIRHFITGLIYMVGMGWAFLMLPAFKTVAHTLLTGAGIIALVAGLASQQVLSNITSGLFMVIFKPFRINDRISFGNNYHGIVEDITLRHTIIRDLENNRIVIPNSVLGGEVIVNAHLGDVNVCKMIDIGISYNSDIDRAFQIMREEVLRHPLHVDHRTEEEIQAGKEEVVTRVVSLADSAIILRVAVWAKNAADAFSLNSDLLKNIKERFDREGVEIPYPQSVVTLTNYPRATN